MTTRQMGDLKQRPSNLPLPLLADGATTQMRAPGMPCALPHPTDAHAKTHAAVSRENWPQPRWYIWALGQLQGTKRVCFERQKKWGLFYWGARMACLGGGKDKKIIFPIPPTLKILLPNCGS